MIRWTYAFVDRPLDRFEAAASFWTAVTGTALSPRRGEHAEFATLVPPDGDACAKLQGVQLGSGGAHLDLSTVDIRGAVAAATACGATVAADHGDWTVLCSPSGQQFCLVPWHGESVVPPVYEGTRLDQVCLDIGPAAYDTEVDFWRALTGWEYHRGSRPEFGVLRVAGGPVRILLQRLDAERPTSAHVDLACADIEAAARRHEAHGAERVDRFPHWIVMRDPAGGTYCLTARDPWTGSL